MTRTYSVVATGGCHRAFEWEGLAPATKAAPAEMRELRFVGVTVGTFEMVAEAWFRSADEMLSFTTEVLVQIPGPSGSSCSRSTRW
jgi:hypothetical protein